jgi:SSS family solute:Na+ symporter
VFWGAILAQIMVLFVFILTKVGVFQMGFLWLNPIGAFGVVGFTLLLNSLMAAKEFKTQK